MKIGTLITNLAKRAKIDLTDPKYVDLLSSAVEVPDEIATAIEGNLFDIETAKNNAALSQHFKASALNGVDAKIKALAEESGLSAEDIAEIEAEKNSYNKLPILNAKVKAKIAAENKGDGKQIKAEYDKLNADMAALKTAQAAEIKSVKEQSEKAILDYAVDSFLASQQYANSDLAPEINVLTAKTVLNKALSEKKAMLVRGADGKLTLKNADAPELDYLQDNKAVSFSDLATSTLASNKLLKVSDPAPQRKPGNTFQQQPNPNGERQPDNSNVIAAIDAQLHTMGSGVN